MRLYDITLPISDHLPVWPGDPAIKIERISSMEDGDAVNVTKLDMSAHVGTHVDAPYHFLGGSHPTAEQLNLKKLIGRVVVIHIPDNVSLITAEVLRQTDIPSRCRRILFRTRNSALWENQKNRFQSGFVAISADGAEWLVDKDIVLVGVDYLSVAPFADTIRTHKILLQAGIVIVEGLDLSQVQQGRYTLYCLPLKIVGSDGAPARVVLIGA
jgi:arylformamidase